MISLLLLLLLIQSIYLIGVKSSNGNNLCSCDDVICGKCMTGCPYTYIYSNSTTNSCSRSNERNQCYCNLIGSNCYENESDVCASSSQPLSQPSSQPTRQPSSQPSSHPTRQPSSQPTRQLSSQPSIPSSQPTRQPSMETTV